MFQTFAAPSDASAIPERLKRLRALIADEGLQALLLPRGDEHQGEDPVEGAAPAEVAFVERDGGADHAGVAAEDLLPRRSAQDHAIAIRRQLLVRKETSAELGFDAKHREQVGRHDGGPKAARLIS